MLHIADRTQDREKFVQRCAIHGRRAPLRRQLLQVYRIGYMARVLAPRVILFENH